MWLPFLGLLLGIIFGLVFSLTIPAQLAPYTAVAILAAFDSVIGAWRATLEGKYDNRIFLSGITTNMVLAGFLTFLGDRLGVNLYLAAVVVFGARLFNNLAIVRRYYLVPGSRG
jgi:small basic protein